MHLFGKLYIPLKCRPSLQDAEQVIRDDINKLRRKLDDLSFEFDNSYTTAVRESYTRHIAIITALSKMQCPYCMRRAVQLIKCSNSECDHYLCNACMLQCEAGDWSQCASTEYYCTAQCDQRRFCVGCKNHVCVECHEKDECDVCFEKVCSFCLEDREAFSDSSSSREPRIEYACKQCTDPTRKKPKSVLRGTYIHHRWQSWDR